MSPVITILTYDTSVFDYPTNDLKLHIARFSDQTIISAKFEMRDGKFFITTLFERNGIEFQATAELISAMQPPRLQVQWGESADYFDFQEEPIMVTNVISIIGPIIMLLYNVRSISGNAATDTEFTHALNVVDSFHDVS